ncbi:DUF2846 domain-containing protein [Acidovorax sp.]|uniref:DUF2846 domain-containing protein n=1 Tax=Acidovorax sp. TaxID=1872122 RepID=UPI002ACD9B0C|nr:DUF2846 domain-containing protein [Acidovorax sp.]MDZ7861208.1 DUF2846 domain-containing protein [Acidovorax sp.]
MRFLTRYFRALALFIAALALVGCAQVPRASVDQEAKAKQFAPQAETASLYIYRDELFGGAISMPVNLNNQNLGYTGPKSFFYLNVAPGRYTIESMAENQATISIDVQAAKNYFVWQEVKMGLFQARSNLTQTDEARGRQGVLASKMIAVKPGIAFAPTGGVPTAVAPAPALVATPVPAPASAPALVPASTAPAPRSGAAPATNTVSMPFVPDSKPVGRVAPPAPAAVAARAAPAAQSVPTAATVPVVSPAQPAPAAATAAAAAPMPASKKESRLQWLKQMRDANLITSGEYETKRQQVLSAP